MIPKIYAATDQAASAAPFPLLDGTVEAAQSYVDAVTHSWWWGNHCKPAFNGEVPTQVVLRYTDMPGWGAGILYSEPEDEKHYIEGKHVPVMMIGQYPSNGDVAPLADTWLLLHELAHVWEYGTFHGKEFLYAFATLVHRFLGINHYLALVEAMRDHKIRLNYRSLNGRNRNQPRLHPLPGSG